MSSVAPPLPSSGFKDDKRDNVTYFESSDPADLTSYTSGTEMEAKLLQKIDWRLMPILWVMYIFNYIDRTNIGNAKIGGMDAELGPSSEKYALALSIFFIGYLLNEVPSNMVLSRTRPSLFLPGIMFIWGAMTVAVVGVHNWAGLTALRFFLGFVEAGFFPGVIFLLSCWYKPSELSQRLAIFYSAAIIAGAFGGLLAGAITEYVSTPTIPGWKWLFIIEGLATCVLAVVSVFILPDYPATTRWLTPEERELAVARLVREESGTSLGHMQAFVAACKDWRTWAFSFAYQMIAGAGTISYFLPTITKTLGYSGRDAQFMTVPIYVFAAIVSNVVAWSADRKDERAYHIVASCFGGMAAFIVCAAVSNPIVRYVMICFGAAGIWSALPIFLSYVSSTIGEPAEKRAVVVAMVNGLGNLASVYGSQIWPDYDKPLYHIGFSTTTAMIFTAGVVILGIRLYVGRPDKQRAANVTSDIASDKPVQV